MNRWEFEQKIVIRALKDPAFKKKLLSQPKEAVREFLKNEKGAGSDLSILDKINFKVIEEKKDEWVLTLPNFQKLQGLSDAELEKLAAGDFGAMSGTFCYLIGL